MTYLEEAADQLRKARAANETRADLAVKLKEAKQPTVDILREVNDRRMELAAAFTRLAEIEAGPAAAKSSPDTPED